MEFPFCAVVCLSSQWILMWLRHQHASLPCNCCVRPHIASYSTMCRALLLLVIGFCLLASQTAFQHFQHNSVDLCVDKKLPNYSLQSISFRGRFVMPSSVLRSRNIRKSFLQLVVSQDASSNFEGPYCWSRAFGRPTFTFMRTADINSWSKEATDRFLLDWALQRNLRLKPDFQVLGGSSLCQLRSAELSQLFCFEDLKAAEYSKNGYDLLERIHRSKACLLAIISAPSIYDSRIRDDLIR